MKSVPLIPFVHAHIPNGSESAGAHFELVQALVEYHGLHASRITSSWRKLFGNLQTGEIVYFQKTALSNVFLALVVRFLGLRSVLYFHEPLTAEERKLKGVPWLKAHLITLFQRVETKMMDELLTGNTANQAFFGKPLRYAPLLMLKGHIYSDWRHRNTALLYFGRLDTEKYFEEFTTLTELKTVVATQNLNIKQNNLPIKRLSVNEKEILFSNHRYVWCVQRHSFTQSAVVLEALRYSCCSLIREDDPIIQQLSPSEYIAIPKNFTSEQVTFALYAYSEKFPNGPNANGSFDRLCGIEAYRQYWMPIFSQMIAR